MSPHQASHSLPSSSPNQALIIIAVLGALAVSVPAQLRFAELPRKVLPPSTSHGAVSLTLGDVDGDGDLDLVTGQFTGQNRLYRNDGTGTFTNVTASQMPAGADFTRSVAFGDVDGDGDLDLVVGNTTNGGGHLNWLYLNDGSGTFTNVTASQMPGTGDRTRSVALGDVDGDLDFVAGNATQQNRLLLNDGTGTFSDATASQMPQVNDSTASMALGDVDGDGDLDLLVGNGDANFEQNRLYLNLQRQLHAPSTPQIGQPYSLDAYMRYGTSTAANLAAVYLSTASASVMTLFGPIGIDPAFAVPFPTLIVPQPAGVGSVVFTVPNLVGQVIYSQAMLVAYPNDLRLSNVVRDVIQ